MRAHLCVGMHVGFVDRVIVVVRAVVRLVVAVVVVVAELF